MRWRQAVAAAPWHVAIADQPNMLIELPSTARNPRGRFVLSVRAKQPVLAEFVTADGVMVPVGPISPSIDYSGPVADFVSVNLHVKKNDEVAYKAYFVGPKRLFETPDPTPVAVSIKTAMKPDMATLMQQLVETVTDTVKRKYGLEVDPKELQEDIADDKYDWDGEQMPLFEDLGHGHMEPDPPPPVVEHRRQHRAEPDPGPALPEQTDLEEAIDEAKGREPTSTAT